MEDGKDFQVQYYDGTTWQTVATYISGIDFENDEFYHVTIYISEELYVFSTDMKIRFLCNSGNNNDDVYIDEVKISAK